jgi:hypothetical protein
MLRRGSAIMLRNFLVMVGLVVGLIAGMLFTAWATRGCE